MALTVSALPAVTLPPLPLASEPARTLPLPVASITPPVSVSYTHLDVYKRQTPVA
ncbi:hypothetical protein [Burkholderia plantarii]|uniref:hypothetical protein n=1 Tax=Burkholderia plantarii TaxID=41899 RepID=UPI00149545E4|nr:hypothetical protein [Burkholderia plantarii]